MAFPYGKSNPGTGIEKKTIIAMASDTISTGLKDYAIGAKLRRLRLRKSMGLVELGKHTGLSDVEYFQTKRAVVHSDEEVPVEVDGEVVTTLPVTFRVSSRKLRVVVPVGREE